MPRVTKLHLQHRIQDLEGLNRRLERDLDLAEKALRTRHEAFDLLKNHINCMTVGNERMADALAHALQYLTQPRPLR